MPSHPMPSRPQARYLSSRERQILTATFITESGLRRNDFDKLRGLLERLGIQQGGKLEDGEMRILLDTACSLVATTRPRIHVKGVQVESNAANTTRAKHQLPSHRGTLVGKAIDDARQQQQQQHEAGQGQDLSLPQTTNITRKIQGVQREKSPPTSSSTAQQLGSKSHGGASPKRESSHVKETVKPLRGLGHSPHHPSDPEEPDRKKEDIHFSPRKPSPSAKRSEQHPSPAPTANSAKRKEKPNRSTGCGSRSPTVDSAPFTGGGSFRDSNNNSLIVGGKSSTSLFPGTGNGGEGEEGLGSSALKQKKEEEEKQRQQRDEETEKEAAAKSQNKKHEEMLGPPNRMLLLQEFITFVDLLKQQFAKRVATTDSDVLEAFMSVGGREDMSGDVSADMLRNRFKDIDLAVDIDRLIEEVDEDGSGKIEYGEFLSLMTNSLMSACVIPADSILLKADDPSISSPQISAKKGDNPLTLTTTAPPQRSHQKNAANSQKMVGADSSAEKKDAQNMSPASTPKEVVVPGEATFADVGVGNKEGVTRSDTRLSHCGEPAHGNLIRLDTNANQSVTLQDNFEKNSPSPCLSAPPPHVQLHVPFEKEEVSIPPFPLPQTATRASAEKQGLQTGEVDLNVVATLEEVTATNLESTIAKEKPRESVAEEKSMPPPSVEESDDDEDEEDRRRRRREQAIAEASPEMLDPFCLFRRLGGDPDEEDHRLLPKAQILAALPNIGLNDDELRNYTYFVSQSYESSFTLETFTDLVAYVDLGYRAAETDASGESGSSRHKSRARSGRASSSGMAGLSQLLAGVKGIGGTSLGGTNKGGRKGFAANNNNNKGSVGTGKGGANDDQANADDEEAGVSPVPDRSALASALATFEGCFGSLPPSLVLAGVGGSGPASSHYFTHKGCTLPPSILHCLYLDVSNLTWFVNFFKRRKDAGLTTPTADRFTRVVDALLQELFKHRGGCSACYADVAKSQKGPSVTERLLKDASLRKTNSGSRARASTAASGRGKSPNSEAQQQQPDTATSQKDLDVDDTDESPTNVSTTTTYRPFTVPTPSMTQSTVWRAGRRGIDERNKRQDAFLIGKIAVPAVPVASLVGSKKIESPRKTNAGGSDEASAAHEAEAVSWSLSSPPRPPRAPKPQNFLRSPKSSSSDANMNSSSRTLSTADSPPKSERTPPLPSLIPSSSQAMSRAVTADTNYTRRPKSLSPPRKGEERDTSFIDSENTSTPYSKREGAKDSSNTKQLPCVSPRADAKGGAVLAISPRIASKYPDVVSDESLIGVHVSSIVGVPNPKLAGVAPRFMPVPDCNAIALRVLRKRAAAAAARGAEEETGINCRQSSSRPHKNRESSPKKSRGQVASAFGNTPPRAAPAPPATSRGPKNKDEKEEEKRGPRHRIEASTSRLPREYERPSPLADSKGVNGTPAAAAAAAERPTAVALRRSLIAKEEARGRAAAHAGPSHTASTASASFLPPLSPSARNE